jgi:hypothetical protein
MSSDRLKSKLLVLNRKRESREHQNRYLKQNSETNKVNDRRASIAHDFSK